MPYFQIQARGNAEEGGQGEPCLQGMDYEKLENLPTINGTSLIGEISLEAFGVNSISNLEIADIIKTNWRNCK